MGKTIKQKVFEILDEVRPALQRHGGDVALKGVKGDTATFLVQGACRGCPLSKITFQMGVEKIIKEKIPEIKKIKYV